MLGVIIGVMSVISIMAIGAGAQSLILNQIKSMGTNLMVVMPGKSEDSSGPPPIARGIIITTLTTKDAEKIEKIPHIDALSPIVMGSANSISPNEEKNLSFQGVGSDFLRVQDFAVSNGRFFSEKDQKSLAKIAFIGDQIAKDMFPNTNPVGQDLKIKHEHFKIIGVMEKRGSTLFFNHDNYVYIPFTTAQKLLLGINYLHALRIKVDEEENTNSVISSVEKFLRRSHNIQDEKKDDFTIQTMAQAVDVLKSVTDALQIFLAAIASIALVVGGIGIMNMMLITVTQRTREIGLRKTVGAKKKDIIIQFLLEASTITIIGGILGIIIGVIFSALVAIAVQQAGYDWSFVISLSSILTALFVSIIIGVIFGIYPALRAANLHPIEALRYQ